MCGKSMSHDEYPARQLIGNAREDNRKDIFSFHREEGLVRCRENESLTGHHTYSSFDTVDSRNTSQSLFWNVRHKVITE